MNIKNLILTFFLLSALNDFSQNNLSGFTAWKLISLSGDVRTNVLFRESESVTNGLSSKQGSSSLMGGANIQTRSFILHPNFLLVDVDAGYNPATNSNKFMVIIPNQAEILTTKTLNTRAILFNQKEISLISFANFAESHQNRETLTSVKSNSKLWGEMLNYKNIFLPFSVNYSKYQWEQTETETLRKLRMSGQGLMVQASKSFTSRDRTGFNYSHNEIVTQNENLLRLANTTDNINLSNNIAIDSKRNYLFNSMISNSFSHGNNKFKRFQTSENLFAKLPKNFTFSSGYSLSLNQQDSAKSNLQSLQNLLSHQLFRSLHTTLNLDYSRMNHTVYIENIIKSGLTVAYTKKISAKGQLSLTYHYSLVHLNKNGRSAAIQTKNEEYILSDNQIILLNRVDINIQSVVVKDSTGTIIYQLNVDYKLIDRNPELEIRRIPGGMIANNMAVYIDYTTVQPGTYKYDTENHSFGANVVLFNSKLNIFYRISITNNKNLHNTEYMKLNYFRQSSVGGRLNFGFINGGAEYDEYMSNINPYRKIAYFVSIQKNYNEKLSFALNGNRQNIYSINENANRKYSDVSGNVGFAIFERTQINLSMIYTNQQGGGIDLNLFTAHGEVSTNIRKMFVKFDMEVYESDYVGAKIIFKGVNISLIRKF